MNTKHPLLNADKVTIVSKSDAKKLFDLVLNAGLPYGYQQANCHNISHYIYLLLKSKGCITSKIWAFAPALYSNSKSKYISFIDKKKLSPTGIIDWGYHVASIIHVQNNKKINKMVIDPGLYPEGPVPYKKWLSDLKTRKLVYLVMDAHWYLFNSSLIPNSQLQFNSDDLINAFKPNVILPYFFSDKLINDFFKYEEECKQNNWLAKGLAINETAIQFFYEEIEPNLKAKAKRALIKEYKNLVGDVFNFVTVIRDNRWNYEMTIEFQEKHQLIIHKYKDIYMENLNKWQLQVSHLEESEDPSK